MCNCSTYYCSEDNQHYPECDFDENVCNFNAKFFNRESSHKEREIIEEDDDDLPF